MQGGVCGCACTQMCSRMCVWDWHGVAHTCAQTWICARMRRECSGRGLHTCVLAHLLALPQVYTWVRVHVYACLAAQTCALAHGGVYTCACVTTGCTCMCVCVCVQLQAPWCVQGCACTHVCSAGSHSWVLHGAGCCWEAWDLQQPCMQGPHCTDMVVQSAAALLAHMCNALHSPCTVILHQAACAQCISLLRTLTMHCTALA